MVGTDAAVDLDVDPVGQPGTPRSSSRTSRIFGSMVAMYCWPPKPGLTVITSTMSTRSSTWATADAGVAGFSATAAVAPSEAMLPSVRCRCVHASACTISRWQPACDVLGGHHVGRQHHQVRLERQRGVRPGRGDDGGTEREVRDELAVHHVPLDAVDAGRLERGDLLAEAAEVDGQHAGGDLDGRR